MDTEPDATATATIASRTPEPAPTSYTLLVVQGKDTGATLVIPAAEGHRVLVGHSASCDLVLTDRRVSRRHLVLEVVTRSAGLAIVLEDLGSSNGTEINGVSVVQGALRGGERVRVGDTVLELRPGMEEQHYPEEARTAFGDLIGGSPQMRRLYARCDRLAASSIPVLIEGETGTGKELMAEALHAMSARAAGPFVVFDCTAVHANLLEAALFGHDRGAYTGAVEAREGAFEAAHGGTLFIDEIGDLALPLQAKLLRAIERSEVQRVGGVKWRKVDARVVAATRRNLDQLIQEGRFRDDLFFRVAVGRIELPPLRKRTGDVIPLLEHFWRALRAPGGVPRELIERVDGYSWPGNVRELRNMVTRLAVLGELAELAVSPAPAADFAIDAVLERDLPFAHARKLVLDEFERRYVERLVERHGGNVAQAARASGLALRYFRLLRARHRE